MNNYIQLKSDADGSFLKVKVVHPSFVAGDQQPRHLDRTITGKVSKSIGTAYKVWRGVARVPHAPPSGYATLANLRNWMTSDSIGHHRLQLIDPFGVTHTVVCTTDLLPEAQLSMHDGAGSFYLVPFELEKR